MWSQPMLHATWHPAAHASKDRNEELLCQRCTVHRESSTVQLAALAPTWVARVATRHILAKNFKTGALGLIRVEHELAVVSADAPRVSRLEPVVVGVAWSVGVAQAVAVCVNLVMLAAVLVDVVTGRTRGARTRIGAVEHAVRVDIPRSSSGGESQQRRERHAEYWQQRSSSTGSRATDTLRFEGPRRGRVGAPLTWTRRRWRHLYGGVVDGFFAVGCELFFQSLDRLEDEIE
jgi:hypothetical protein